jgi:hypothetical protein
MRNLFYLILTLLFSTGCLFHKQVSFVGEGGGSFMDPVADSLKKDIRIIHFEHSLGVIFPAEFAEKKFGRNYNRQKLKGFFTPDTDLIRKIDKEVNYQYCNSKEKADQSFFAGLAKNAARNTPTYKISKELQNIIDKMSAQNCLYWQDNSVYFDKQYVGYFTDTGEKVIKIRLIDFRQDPHKLKHFLPSAWINGWHGWFYSNIYEMSFNVNENLLTIDE